MSRQYLSVFISNYRHLSAVRVASTAWRLVRGSAVPVPLIRIIRFIRYFPAVLCVRRMTPAFHWSLEYEKLLPSQAKGEKRWR